MKIRKIITVLTQYYIFYVILETYMLDSDQEPSYTKSFITAKDTEVDRRYGK